MNTKTTPAPVKAWAVVRPDGVIMIRSITDRKSNAKEHADFCKCFLSQRYRAVRVLITEITK